MEWLPKILDTFDSSVFSLRLAWAGYLGNRFKFLLKVGAVGSAVVAYPAATVVLIAAVSTYWITEMTYRGWLAASRVKSPLLQR